MKEIAYSFAIVGDVISVEPYGEGHINSTYLVTTYNARYVLQKINDKIFGNVDGLMNNIVVVTEFIKSKGMETLSVVPTKDGKRYLKGGYGFLPYVRVHRKYGNIPNCDGQKNVRTVRRSVRQFPKRIKRLQRGAIDRNDSVFSRYAQTV